MTWLTALTAWPAPIGPTWVMVRPRAWSTGRARSTSASAPPTKMVRVALRAPSLPPETGRVDHGQAALAESRREVPAAGRGDGRAVDDERAGPSAVDDAVVPEQDRLDVRRIRHAQDDDVAAAGGVGRAGRGLDARARPALALGRRVQFQTTSGNPARARLAAMADPIVPRPRKATRSTGRW